MYIRFAKEDFEIREINLPELGNVLISTDNLNELLLNESGGYISEEAQQVDEQIFYFVNKTEIKFTDEKLIHLISKQVL